MVLRDRVLDYAIAHGIGDLSLRPLARALGTSARMLVYHFGSREFLLRAILEGLRAREDARIEDWWRTAAEPTLPKFVLWYWKRVSTPKARPALKLVFEVYAMALRSPHRFPGVLESPVAYWKRLSRRAGVGRGRSVETEATLALAAIRGFLLDLAATGERTRITRAVEAFVRKRSQRSEPPAAGRS